MADSKLLKFIGRDQRQPTKRPAGERAADFAEIHVAYAREMAEAQAGRCSQCGVPFCQVHCPLGNDIPDWLKLTAEGRLEEAYELSQATNNMPEVCGRICPQDRLCEGNCVIEKGFGSVTIGSIEKFLTDTAWEQGWVRPLVPGPARGQSVGIVGAGPAGLAAAEELRRRGYEVTIYDRHDRAGGLLVYGIPNFKLDKQVVMRRVARLEAGGIVFRLRFEVGRDATLADLRARHDAVLVATGVYQARDVQVPGSGLDGIVPAMTYLVASNRKGLGDEVPDFDTGVLDARGRDVVVVGGGDTAMDCVRTAVRQGARSVRCLYRRDRANMPGSMREVAHAEEEGVEFIWLAAPQAFLGDGRVSGVRVQRMRLGLADASGRQSPEPAQDGGFTLDADLVIKALGYDPEDLAVAFDAPGLAVVRGGTLKTDFRTMMTSLDGVFAAGDIVRGASLVVWAIRDGRDAAERIHQHLLAKAGAAVAAE
jgi:glutamate synthase (NADPH/NADH) small chain